MVITASEARAPLSKLIEATTKGEEFLITKRGKPVAVLRATAARPRG